MSRVTHSEPGLPMPLLAGIPLYPSLARRQSTNRFSSKRKVPNRNKTNSSIKPNTFHSKYVRLAGRKSRKERKICLGFPQRLVMGSTTTAARKVVSSSTLIGSFRFLSARSNSTAACARAQIQTGSLGCVTRDKNVTGC